MSKATKVAKRLRGRYARNNRRKRSYLKENDRRMRWGDADKQAAFQKLQRQFESLERQFDKALRARNVRVKVYGQKGTR